MAADSQAVVAREDDDRAGRLSRVVDRGQDAADLRVHVRDDGVVCREFRSDILSCARRRQQPFVAAVQVSVIERVGCQKVHRQRQAVGRVAPLVTGREQAWIVWGREVHV